MQRALIIFPLVAAASLMVVFNTVAADTSNTDAADTSAIRPANSKQAVAADVGEVRAVDYYQHQGRCATVPRFADQVTLIGSATGDPEKDTFAYPVTSMDTVCAASRTR